MAINERLIHTAAEAAAAGTGNQQEGLILHLDANDVDSYDGDGTVWYDITNHEYTPATDVSEHFNTVTYDGSSSDQSITGVGFQPDLVWIKCRDVANSHVLSDSVRGGDGTRQYFLMTDNTNAQSSSNQIETIDSDGFTVFGDRSATNRLNQEYVAWCFKAGGAPTASNPYMIDGTGYSTLSAAGLADDGDLDLNKASINTKLGFGIYNFDPNNVSGETASFEHGLGATPELIITKSASDTYNWWTWTNQRDGSWDYLKLNASDAKANDTITSGAFADATTMRFAYGFTGTSSDHVAYAFTSKRGISKVGNYTGSTGSVTVNTGFKPAFIMIKNADVAGDPWVIFDNKRGGNGEYDYLYPNENYAEAAGDSTLNSGRTGITFNADGFTLDDDDSHSVNESGKKFIYLAIAEKNPDSLTPLLDEYSKGNVVDTNLFLHYDPYMSSSYGGTGTTLTDLKGNNNADLLGGIESSYNSDYGYFDITGSGDGITTSSVVSINPATTGMTVEMWIRIDSDTQNYLFSFDGTGTTYNALSYRSNTDKIEWFYRTGSAASSNISSPTVTIGQWHHLVATTNGSGAQIYLDGVVGGTTTSSAYSVNYNEDLHFGNYQDLAQTSNVQIGQIRFYKGHLSATDVKTNYDATKGNYAPELDLHLDPTSYSGSGTTWTADTGSNATVVASRYDQELGDSFDISTDSESTIVIPSGHPLNDNNFTLEFWFRSTENWNNSGKGHYFIYEGSAAGWNFFYYEGYGWRLSAPVATGYFGNNTVVTNKWHHVSLTYTSGVTKFYLDGKLLKTHSETRSSSSLGAFDFGSTEAAAYKPKCLVGQIRMYSQALTADEVMRNYQFTKNDYTNGYNGTISSATWDDGSSETDTPGYFSFNGSASVTTTLDLTSGYLTTDGGYTLLAWFRLASSPNALNAIFGDANIVFGVGGGNITGSYSNESLWLYQTSPYIAHWGNEGEGVYADQEWHHIALTVIGTSTSNKLFYVDGVLETMTAQAGQSEPWTFTDLRIGNTGTSSSYNLKGDIAEVKVFDRVLPLSEIKTEFNLRCEEFGLTKLT